MASPQKENGFTPIANELLEAFLIYKFTEYQRVVILFIFRKTYGWSKKEDWISNSQFVEGTGIPKGHISRTLKELKLLKVVTCRGNNLSINKDWESWGVTCRGNKSYLYRQQSVTSTGTTKERKKKETSTSSKEEEVITPLKKKNMKTINIDTGEYEEKPKKAHKREDVIKLAKMFDKMASDYSGKPIITSRSYYIVLNAINIHKMTPLGIEELFKDWFSQDKIKMENKVLLSWCLGKDNINKFKVKN